MDRWFTALILGGALTAQLVVAGARAEQSANPQLAMESDTAATKFPAMPAAPKGKSTIMGGEIQKLDPMRDQFQLKSIGQKPMTILFDERTQVFLDGKRIRLRELRSDSAASVQTILDGTNVFAISIHLLSGAPEGDLQGQVLSYNLDTRELTVSGAASKDPLKLIVPLNTPITRVGQGESSALHSGTSDLIKGTIISLTFQSSKKGQGIASKIEILATPGAAFVFGGSLSSLDMHTGLLTVIDPRDERNYEIAFDPSRFPASQTLHEGDNVRVTATFDGSRYVASSIALD